MRVACIGGGPAGLYSALLLKKSDQAHTVTVVDRNPPEATYGFGVVFSDETLSFLRDADPETYASIAKHFVFWDAIDIFRSGQRIRSGGHAFSGLARTTLLQVLRARCAELGVRFHYDTHVADADEYADCDLIIAADGANSTVRAAHQAVFKTTFDAHASRYIWLGCARPFPAFTFAFRESPGHGMFQIHAYPFSASRSTVIVECSEATWQRAGLDRCTEEQSVQFCEELFREELSGEPLQSNRSSWITFVTLRNETWHSGKTVLVGDAAHTAHFSIGSGTKLAMEDAIALAAAIAKHARISPALVEYEELRQPIVERTQAAARDSSRWFENTDRYRSLEPIQFAFSLLTRSKRITYENLRLRDAGFANSVDDWFARQAEPERQFATSEAAAEPLAAPLKLRELRLPNRLACTPPIADCDDGLPDAQQTGARLASASRAGAGLVIAPLVAVCAQGRVTSDSPGLYGPHHAVEWAQIAEGVHRVPGARMALQLVHAGRRGATRPRREGVDRPLPGGGWPLVSASAIPYAVGSQRPAELQLSAVPELVENFAKSARWAADAGVDLLELHMGHGYLLGSFLSPLSNMRTDVYGGTPERRQRLCYEVFDAVRNVWPSSRPLAVCFSVTDWAAGGISEQDTLRFAADLRDRGCDVLHCVSGQTVSTANPPYGRAWQMAWSDSFRNSLHIASMASGQITSRDEVNTAIAAGRADLCAVAAYDLPLPLPAEHPA